MITGDAGVENGAAASLNRVARKGYLRARSRHVMVRLVDQLFRIILIVTGTSSPLELQADSTAMRVPPDLSRGDSIG
jgi:hypothetical protein